MNDNNIKFEFVSVYVIGIGGNLSVGAPFCKGCPKRRIHIINKNERVNDLSLSLNEIASYKKLPNISSFSEFISLYDDLYSIIKAKQLGKKCDNDMKNKLEGVKSRIFNSLNEEQKKIFEEKWNKLYEMITKDVHDYTIGTAGIKKK